MTNTRKHTDLLLVLVFVLVLSFLGLLVVLRLHLFQLVIEPTGSKSTGQRTEPRFYETKSPTGDLPWRYPLFGVVLAFGGLVVLRGRIEAVVFFELALKDERTSVPE